MLYLPWCNETVDLLGSHATAKQFFVSNNDRLLVLCGDQATFAAEVEIEGRKCGNLLLVYGHYFLHTYLFLFTHVIGQPFRLSTV